MTKGDANIFNKGRTGINDMRRNNSLSRRAIDNKICIEKCYCPKCGHHKAIKNESLKSPFYNRLRCSRCGFIHESNRNNRRLRKTS